MAKAKVAKSRVQQERAKVVREIQSLTENLAIKLAIRDTLDALVAKGLDLPDCTSKKK